MKLHSILFLHLVILVFIFTAPIAQAQRSVLVAVNDTVNITPGIAVTVKLLFQCNISATMKPKLFSHDD